MNIRYFFIASAITSGLALALQDSDRIVNKEEAPIVSPYTVDEVDKNDLQLLEPTSGSFDTSDILKNKSNCCKKERGIDDLYHTGKNLLYALTDFLRSAIMVCVQILFYKKIGSLF